MLGSALHRITPGEIVYAVTMFAIVRLTIKIITWCLREAEHFAEKEFKSEIQEKIYRHVHSRHEGKPVNCPDCATIVTLDECAL